MLRCNVDLYRSAARCVSKNETRYYLQGVFVEPCAAGGVLLVATDGVRLIVIRDEAGAADESAIIRIDNSALRVKALGRRDIVLQTGAEDARICAVTELHDGALDDHLLAVSPACRVDGTFPDYRHAVPQNVSNKAAPVFAGAYMAEFGEIAGELAWHFHGWRPRRNSCGAQREDTMCILPSGPHPERSPAVVIFPRVPQAFGVLAPCERPEGECVTLPKWFTGAD